MDRQELHDRLIAANVDPRVFDVLGSDPDPFPGDIFVLRHVQIRDAGTPNYWPTYYCERGGRYFASRFASEDEACRHLFLQITKSPIITP